MKLQILTAGRVLRGSRRATRSAGQHAVADAPLNSRSGGHRAAPKRRPHGGLQVEKASGMRAYSKQEVRQAGEASSWGSVSLLRRQQNSEKQMRRSCSTTTPVIVPYFYTSGGGNKKVRATGRAPRARYSQTRVARPRVERSYQADATRKRPGVGSSRGRIARFMLKRFALVITLLHQRRIVFAAANSFGRNRPERAWAVRAAARSKDGQPPARRSPRPIATQTGTDQANYVAEILGKPPSTQYPVADMSRAVDRTTRRSRTRSAFV